MAYLFTDCGVEQPYDDTGTTTYGNTNTYLQHTNQAVYNDTDSMVLNTSVSNQARDKYTVLNGDGSDIVTVMVYMCGADLESEYGAATADLTEMAYATHSDAVNVVVQTGGATTWNNSIVSGEYNQRYLITDESLTVLDRNCGKGSMTDPDTLSDFISWGKEAYPANRYILILWDHGGGSLGGYGYDENYPNDEAMSVSEIEDALNEADVQFDIVGFDACLMANVETALAVEPNADYLIASEETEPGEGWYYTDWLSTLAKNPSVPTTELGKIIIDDFIEHNDSDDSLTLSMVDLAEFSGTVPEKFNAFSDTLKDAVQSDAYESVVKARGGAKDFYSSGSIDQIDLMDFCENLNTEESLALKEVLQECVKYNRAVNSSNSYGISIYFPYKNGQNVSAAVSLYNDIGMDESYTEAVRSFATLSTAGQTATTYNTTGIYDLLNGSTGSSQSDYGYDSADLFELLFGENNYGYRVSDEEQERIVQYISENHLDESALEYTENSEGQTVISMSEEEWSLVSDIALNVWVDDGQGYIDLGNDNVYSFDEEGNLIVSYNGAWVGINADPVAYYVTTYEYTDENNWVQEGYIPAMLNGEAVRIIVRFSNEVPEGEILGAEKVYDSALSARGYIPIQKGDTIDYLCTCYTYDGELDETYYLGEQVTVGDTFEVGYYTLSEDRIIFGYTFTDIYNTDINTQMMEWE